MNAYYVSAGGLTLVLAAAHSVLGEVLIWKRVRARGGAGPTGLALPRRHLAALWSTWHLISLLACGISALFFTLGSAASPSEAIRYCSHVLSLTFLLSAGFWCYGTRARHPAWIVFLVIATLVSAASRRY